ncbi:MAG: PBP1A family penicillin-binding protein [Alphaproteobacteria bacterium]|nr:PBP1A family penicillin-binding protein [Alphaproteobacteria bacterium]
MSKRPSPRPAAGREPDPDVSPIATWDYWWPIFLRTGVTGVLVGVVTLGLLWNTLFAQMPVLPSKDALWEMNREPAVQFVDAKGDTIAVRGPHYGHAVKLADLPPHVVNAFIAAEDKRFLTHEGVDAVAVVRATLSNVRAGHTVQGASTITQQLVKNLFLTPDQTLKRKAQEARLAYELEHMLTKDEILDLYLNRIYLGAGAYGLDAAAHTYFDTSPQDLTIAESAMLAAFPKAPTRFASTADTPAAKQRQIYVLDQMVDAHFITPEQGASAKRQTLHFASDKPDVFAGHALDYAFDQVHSLMSSPPADLVVQLSLDLDLQAKTQKAVDDGLKTMGAEKHASEAAALLVDTSGAIRAMVGGKDYNKSQFNRAVQARRQPGSSFKMFVYAAALEAGLRPGSVRYDEPISIGNWRPRNYGGSYRGAVTLSEALAESLNTVAAEVGDEVGMDKVTDLARRFGVRSELHNYPSVALGSDEVTLLDMVTGYGVLAKDGLQMAPYIIQSISDSRGDVLFQQPATESPRIYDQKLAEDMTGMLSRVVVQGTGRAAQVPGWEVAGKTGTSQDWRDAWFIGYNTKYVGGVWVGNDNDTPMTKVTGGEMPARIWSAMMAGALDGVTPEPLPGAKQAEEFLTNEDQDRLNFYRRLESAFASVAARQVASRDGL